MDVYDFIVVAVGIGDNCSSSYLNVSDVLKLKL